MELKKADTYNARTAGIARMATAAAAANTAAAAPTRPAAVAAGAGPQQQRSPHKYKQVWCHVGGVHRDI